MIRKLVKLLKVLTRMVYGGRSWFCSVMFVVLSNATVVLMYRSVRLLLLAPRCDFCDPLSFCTGGFNAFRNNVSPPTNRAWSS